MLTIKEMVGLKNKNYIFSFESSINSDWQNKRFFYMHITDFEIKYFKTNKKDSFLKTNMHKILFLKCSMRFLNDRKMMNALLLVRLLKVLKFRSWD